MSCGFGDAVAFLRHPLAAGRYGTGPLGLYPSAVVAGLQAGCPRALELAFHVVFGCTELLSGTVQRVFESVQFTVDTKGGNSCCDI